MSVLTSLMMGAADITASEDDPIQGRVVLHLVTGEKVVGRIECCDEEMTSVVDRYQARRTNHGESYQHLLDFALHLSTPAIIGIEYAETLEG